MTSLHPDDLSQTCDLLIMLRDLLHLNGDNALEFGQAGGELRVVRGQELQLAIGAVVAFFFLGIMSVC